MKDDFLSYLNEFLKYRLVWERQAQKYDDDRIEYKRNICELASDICDAREMLSQIITSTNSSRFTIFYILISINMLLLIFLFIYILMG